MAVNNFITVSTYQYEERMKSEKEIKMIESNVKNYLKDGLIKKGNYTYLTDFYLKNAKKTLQTANALMQISDKKELKKLLGFLDDFETYLWVIVSSYYSMFYALNSLLSKNGLKVGDKIAHKVSLDVFYIYFIKNDKIAKELFELYEEAKEDSMDLTKYSEQAENLSIDLENEMFKRSKFQYEMSESIKRSHALTSLRRAKEFFNKLEAVINISSL